MDWGLGLSWGASDLKEGEGEEGLIIGVGRKGGEGNGWAWSVGIDFVISRWELRDSGWELLVSSAKDSGFGFWG